MEKDIVVFFHQNIGKGGREQRAERKHSERTPAFCSSRLFVLSFSLGTTITRVSFWQSGSFFAILGTPGNVRRTFAMASSARAFCLQSLVCVKKDGAQLSDAS